jgi:hypothetical protein
MEMIIDKPLPGLTRQATARIVAFFTDRTCGEACWKAKEDICRCECGGKNHGIQLRTGQNGVRAAKIGGHRYELVAVGKHSELMDQGATLTCEDWLANGKTKARNYYGDQTDRIPYERSDLFYIDSDGKESPKGYIAMHNLKGGGSLYCVKYASLPQCLKWQELEYFEIADDRDRYQSNAAILWKRTDII